MAKYKVGDKVRIVSERPQKHWNPDMDEWLGKTMTITASGRNGDGEIYYRMFDDVVRGGSWWHWYEFMIAGLAEPEQAPCTVELRFDGTIITATLKRGGRGVKTAEARCNPKDIYSRGEGARVAVERLFEKKRKEDKPKESKPKIGDKFVVTVEGGRFGHGFNVGDVVTLVKIYQHGIFNGCFDLVDKDGLTQILHPSEVRPYKEKSK